jgi:GT2 family glycosyltransferase
MTDNFIGVTSAVIVRRALLEAVGGFSTELKALQDYELYIRLIKAGAKLYGTPEPLIEYFTGEDEARKISCRYDYFRQARQHLLEKYACDEYYSLLQRALFIIGIKKAFKSRQFMQGVFKMRSPAVLKMLFSI